MVGANDQVATGIVTNLARPDANVTGTSSQNAASWPKVFDVIRQLLPSVKRVAALWDPINAISQQLRMGETLIAAAKLQVLVRVVEVQAREDLERAFDGLVAWRPDAILVPSDTFFTGNAARVAELGTTRRIPVFSTSRLITEAGALASYGSSLDAVSYRAAWYVQRLLKGARPGELAIELPTRFELVINLRTARAIGLELPPNALAGADVVIR
jgi:putative ABC transport system substrate-binding protein